MTKTWYFLRHGKPVSTGILTGSRTDVAVSKVGLAEMKLALPQTVQFDACISSPMQRCLVFAKQLSKQLDIALTVEERLQEMDFGDWDGRAYDWLWENTQNPSIGEFWQAPWQHTPPNGESLCEFRSRVSQWWETELLTRHTAHNLVVTHAGVIKQILAELLSLPLDSLSSINSLEVGYASLVKIEVYFDEAHKPWPKVVF
ncbi:MAG: histidine phosphatase family protein [Pseudomonadota bacterium]